jgi:outer membrane cobalamin receptor
VVLPPFVSWFVRLPLVRAPLLRTPFLRTALAVLLAVSTALAARAEAPTATLRGRVLDARTGEPIRNALVVIFERRVETATDAAGEFAFSDLAIGDAELAVTTVGYGIVRKSVRIEASAAPLEIRLGQDAYKRTEEITVEARGFSSADPAAPAAHGLFGVELKNLASVLADDPLRSVQSLPGIAAGDDFSASFAARGLGFASVGLYLDGVLLTAPFHTVRDVNDGFSLTILNGDVVDHLSLVSGAAPARYGDRTGAVLNVRTREGSREEFFGRASLGATGLHGTLEGPLGRERKTSWLVSARKSYLDYVLDRVADDAGIVLGYYDATAKLSHHPTPAQTYSLLLLHGKSRWRSTEPDLRPQSLLTADARTDVASLQWRYLPSARLWLDAGAFLSQESGRNRTLDGTDRFNSRGRQWGARVDVTRLASRHRLEAGVLLRRLGERAVGRGYDPLLKNYRTTDSYAAGAAQWGAYAQDTWMPLGDRLALTLGGRFDRFEETGESHLLPRAAASLALTPRTKAVAALGAYAQFPSFGQLYGFGGNHELTSERSRHLTVAVERLLTPTLRARVEAYEQRESDLLWSPDAEWRMLGSLIRPGRASASWLNALSGRSRGVELLLQRRSANGLSGWIGYGLAHARRFDPKRGLGFDSDYDQRHTLTVYASRRLGGTLNLSTKYRYGSGFPIAGFYRAKAGDVFLSTDRNGLRAEPYSRWDVRVNKAFACRRLKLTLYGEVINLLNHTHMRYTGLDSVNIRTGRVFLENETLFPRLPSLGVTVEF